MKYFIASDIHGSSFYCEKMLKAFEMEKADKILLLGDPGAFLYQDDVRIFRQAQFVYSRKALSAYEYNSVGFAASFSLLR